MRLADHAAKHLAMALRLDDDFDDDLDEDDEDRDEEDDEEDDEDEETETWQVSSINTVPLKADSGLTSGNDLPRLAKFSEFS